MIPKPHLEFHTLDMETGWETPEGYPDGIEQKILAGSLDEEAGTGHRTRLLRFGPGVYTTAPFRHTYWEERSTNSAATSPWAATSGAREARASAPAPTPAAPPAWTTARSRANPAACC